MANRALSGLCVLDFGQYLAGPLTAMMLADQGAEVIRVDPPGGPRWQHPANATLQRGKQVFTLDLKQEADRHRARDLLRAADVLIENFRPGVMGHLGLGPEDARAINPGLVYCSLPGFAANDPRAGLAAWEGVVGAAANAYLPPWSGLSPDPVYTALPLPSVYASFLAATAIVLALFARGRDGHGRRIEVPLFHAMFQAFGAYAMSGDNAGAPAFSSDIWGAGCYRCADGRWVMYATHRPKFVEALVEAGNVPEWRALGLLDRERLRQEPSLLTELRRRIAALFATRPAADWERELNARGAPLIVVRSAAEWMTSEHARTSRAVVPLDDPELGQGWQLGFPVQLSDTPPAAGAHRALSDRATFASKHHGGASPPRAPLASLLEGIKVLDLTQVLAGPTGARLLAEFGAEVVKVNDPASPPEGYRYHLDVNRGKRTLLLDLRQPAGRAAFLRLVQGADIVMQNFAKGVPERLGIGYADLARHKPDLIYATVSAYGQHGPWGGWRGYEPLGQAIAGLQHRFGGDGPPMMEPLAVSDYGTGILAAFAVALALYHRQRGGGGQAVEASLAWTASYLQAPLLQLHPGKRWDEPRGQAAKGSGPLQRLYRAADGWLFLGAREAQLAAMDAVEGLRGIAGLQGEALERALEERIATASVGAWIARLTPIDVGVSGQPTIAQLMSDPYVRAEGLSITRTHEGVGSVTGIGPSVRMEPSPPQPGRPVRPAGADGREILREAGYAESEIDALVRHGVVGSL
ncbi:MAG TPA: CoA transferase [Kiloniellales bacterium]|nr:CoA transferase [Kiloniellales bacterium]